MRPYLCVALLFLAQPAFAQEAKPNTLTPKEIAQGWVLLFDGTSDFGWRGDGKIQVVDGNLAIRGDGMKAASVRHTGDFGNVEAAFKCREIGKKGGNIVYWGNYGHEIVPPFFSLPNPKATATNAWLIWTGRNRRSFDGDTQLAFNVRPGSLLYLKDIRLRFDALKPIFNGKDLTGWHEFPGKKSRFTVTPDGTINIKNGPGDLQTNEKYGDFVLQIECKSNGPHLNSGVFFRCRPNEYQNGYEAQIRNEFTAKPTQTYTLEEYDPLTHTLLTKKKAKFTAIDYGTGAIYRRQPARKQVSKDGEWFTMTVLARKNHLMTWVNGIQVTDWIDNRPPSDNARTGCRLEAGHISLQGHDPTTDLNFRNIRIGEIN